MVISLVTPSLNQGRFLAETLASVRTAAARAPSITIEHIVQDGGSTDDTLEILSSQDFAQWKSEPDAGQSQAINRALSRCKGDILAYLCSDDLIEPDTIRVVADAFEAHPGCDVVYGDYFFLESDTGWKRRKVAGAFSVERLRRCNFLSQPATFWRRSVYERHGGFDESLRYCMDHEYWLRIAADSQFQYVPEPLASMRLHADAKTASALAPMWWESARMQQRYGHGWRPYCEAIAMSLYGQHYYRMKRRFFRWLGRRQARRAGYREGAG